MLSGKHIAGIFFTCVLLAFVVTLVVLVVSNVNSLL